MSLRATYHLQPRSGWLNDPNGMIHHDGRWHVFYQHNPDAPRHHQIAWGHASSPDLVDWTEHPVAFRPQPEGPDRAGCWSGVAVDLGDRVAVAYTGIVGAAAGSTVCIRYAADPTLDVWSDPVVAAVEPEGIGLKEMRDPFLFTWNGRRLALLGAWLAGGPGLLLWSCDDLEAWRFERVWLTGEDPVLGPVALADVWECPQLLGIDGTWVLVLSTWRAGNLDKVVYASGSLADDRGLPALQVRHAGVADGGGELYAPQAVQDVPDGGGPLLLGWVREADVPDVTPDFEAPVAAHEVAGCLTLPRRLSLVGDRLVSTVDGVVQGLAGALVEDWARGLPSAAVLVVGPSGAVLRGSTVKVEVPAGAQVWLDGEVLEAYPLDGTPLTYRDPGTLTWTVDGDVAEVREVSVRS